MHGGTIHILAARVSSIRLSNASTLTIDTLVFVRSLGSGEVLAAPLADGTLASVADEEEALLDQRLALAEHLGTADPETIARFSFPKETELRIADVVVPREDLPRKLAITTPISIATAVVPSSPLAISRPRENEARVRAERWLVIIPLAYTSYLAFDERLDVTGLTDGAVEKLAQERLAAATDRRIADEVRRLWLAQGEGPSAWLSLLPGRRVQLAPVAVDLVRDDSGPAGRAATLKKRLVEKERRERAVAVLDSVAQAVHLTRKQYEGAPPPLVGRERELDLLRKLFSPNKDGERQSVVLVGHDRVGKSALLHGFVDAELGAGRSPVVYATSGAALIAGMSGLGQWQERVRRVMQAACDLGAILWFDDLGDLFSERGRSSVDVPSALRPWIEQGKVSIVGEAHEDRIDKMERANVGFFAATSRLRVPPLDATTTLQALRARVAWDEKRTPDAPRLEEAAHAPLVDLAERYLAYESFPGKAIRLYDELRAMHGAGSEKKRIGVDEMFEATSLRTGVPAFLLREDRALHLDEVVSQLRTRVIGQDEAVRRVAETVCVVKAGLSPRGKPLATFLFVGPTGVGKTELARALAELLFRDPQRMTRFDMSEYMDPLAADRLIRGSSEGRGEGVLTRKVREQPFCVLLLDEIEKAHPMVFDLLLQVCGEGRLTDAAGRTAFFHNAIIILTSNLGARERRAAVGFGDKSETTDHYERALVSAFRPEFLNRIDRVVAFRDLGPEHKKTLVAMSLEKVRRRRGILEPGCALSVSDAAIETLGEAGYSPSLGARALRRHVENTVVSAVGELIAGFGEASDVDIDVRTIDEPPIPLPARALDRGGLRVSLVRRGSTKATHEAAAMRDIAEVRRELTRWLRLDRTVEVREQVKFLVAQLGYGKKEQRSTYGREAQDHGKLQAEHHRLSNLVAALDGQADTVRAIEDLALDAYFRGDTIASLRRDARETRSMFIAPFVSTLVAQEPRREEVTLILQEVDDGRALGHYLPGLFGFAETSGLVLEAHLDRGDRDGVPSWPEARRWGPPRDLVYLQQRLAPNDRAPTAVMVRLKGPDAILLAFEGGLHRFLGVREGGPAHLFITRLALRTKFTDAQWEVLDPDPPTAFSERVRQPINRLSDYDNRRVWVTTRKNLEIDPRQYWQSFREIVMHHLLLCEEGKLDRDEALRGRLPGDDDEIRTLLETEGKISAIRRYRELTGVGLKAAKDAVDAMETK